MVAVVILVMMYIVCVIGLLFIVAVVELVMENNVQIGLNYLNSIVNYKFGSQCIYCNYHNHDNHDS